MTFSRYRYSAFAKGRPAPFLAIEPDASARLMLHRPGETNLANDLSRWVLVRNRRRPLEHSWATLRRSRQLLDEPKAQRR